MRTNLPRAVPALRLKRGWRQADLAARAGCTRQAVSPLECGGAGTLKVATLDAIMQALGASLDVVLRWEGALLDRTLDAAHAGIVEILVAHLRGCGWETRLEVSFNHYGDRGRVDVLAYHQATVTLLIIEVKTVIGDLQDALGRLDVKVPPGVRPGGFGRLASSAADAAGDRPHGFTRSPCAGGSASGRLPALPAPRPAGPGLVAAARDTGADGAALVRERPQCRLCERYARPASPSCTNGCLMLTRRAFVHFAVGRRA